MLNNRFMQLSIGIVAVKQLLLGASTYYIALAGQAVAHQDFDKTMLCVVLFFVLALVAYVVHSVNQWLLLKCQQQLFGEYTAKFFASIQNKQTVNYAKAKSETVAWFSGEARQTLAKTVTFISQSVDLYLNIIITFVVFYYTVGRAMSAIIGLAFALSLFLVVASKKPIAKLASAQQTYHWQLNQYFPVHWDYMLFTYDDQMQKSTQTITDKINRYYHSEASYITVEQLIATVPIVLCVISLIVYLLVTQIAIDKLAMMIAVLPRTLQLLGSVHSVAANNTQLTRIKTQYHKVIHYQPPVIDIHRNIAVDKINIRHLPDGWPYTVDEFLCCYLANNEQLVGRFVVSGANGVGKSSFLKWLKASNTGACALFLSPESEFDYGNQGLSTGQAQYARLNDFLTTATQDDNVAVLLLDEWDANFDTQHIAKIDKYLDKLAKERLIVEIRHR